MTDMKRYNALIQVTAKPMTRQEYNDLRGWDLPADEDGTDDGYLTVDINGLVNLEGYHGHVSWQPKYNFDGQFLEAEQGQPETLSELPNKVTIDALTKLANSGQTDFTNIAGTLTHCSIALPCGYQVTGESACIDPAEYKEEIGREIARNNAVNSLWPLEGCLLANDRYRAKQAAIKLELDRREGRSYEDNAKCETCQRSYL